MSSHISLFGAVHSQRFPNKQLTER